MDEDEGLELMMHVTCLGQSSSKRFSVHGRYRSECILGVLILRQERIEIEQFGINNLQAVSAHRAFFTCLASVSK